MYFAVNYIYSNLEEDLPVNTELQNRLMNFMDFKILQSALSFRWFQNISFYMLTYWEPHMVTSISETNLICLRASVSPMLPWPNRVPFIIVFNLDRVNPGSMSYHQLPYRGVYSIIPTRPALASPWPNWYWFLIVLKILAKSSRRINQPEKKLKNK